MGNVRNPGLKSKMAADPDHRGGNRNQGIGYHNVVQYSCVIHQMKALSAYFHSKNSLEQNI